MATGHPAVVVFGAGAIGATVRARPQDEQRTIKLAAVSEIAGIQRPDWLVLAVKNYDLEAAARDLRASLNGDPTVIASQNGIEPCACLQAHLPATRKIELQTLPNARWS